MDDGRRIAPANPRLRNRQRSSRSRLPRARHHSTFDLTLNRPATFDAGLYFGDVSLDAFARLRTGAEPWLSFEKARAFFAEGNPPQARTILESIALMPAIESRVRLQAWHSLREAGGQPPASVATEVLGVIVEVDMSKGQDFLATYADQTAYYYNYSGAAMIWLRPDTSLDGQINSVLAAARVILPLIGLPWKEPRRPPPSAGNARLNILTAMGLHFGEGPLRALDRDRNAQPLLRAATALMAKLTKLPRH
jgi:hypothetical protein